MSEEFERLVAEFEKFQARIERADDRFADLDQMRAEIVAIEASATSPDRSVTVVAGAGGAVTDIRFTEEAVRQRPDALARTVLATLHQAVAAAAREQAGVVEQYYGDDMRLVEQVFEAQAEAFGTTVEALAGPEETEAAPPDPDDLEQRPILRDHTSTPAPSPPTRPSRSAGDDFLRNIGHEEDN